MSRIKLIIFIYFLVFPFTVWAQKRGSVWCFGDSAAIDFGTGIPVPGISSLNTRGSCVAIGDLNGDLLFYAETRATLAGNTGLVFNKNHVLMQNGDSVLGQGWYHEMVAFPDPANDSTYYLFSIGVTNSSLPGIFYSKINFSQNSLGAVTQKNISLLSNIRMVDCLTAIKHGNGRDWWVIARKSTFGTGTGNNIWYTYLVSPTGISNVNVQNVGSLNGTNNGNITFFSDSSKLIFTNLAGLIELYDFDRCTGIISDPINIEPQVPQPNPMYWSSEFSPSGRYLYVSASKTPSSLWQFDTWSSNIDSTKTLIWQTSYPPYSAGALKRAPDNKIYFSCAWSDSVGNFNYPYPDSAFYLENMNLSVINSPDSAGAACDFQPWSFYLGGKRTYWGLPNNPDYDLPALSGSPCDTLLGVNELNATQNSELFVYFSPNWQTAFINAQKLNGHTYSLSVYDLLGNEVFKENGNLNPPFFTKNLNCTAFAKGIYVVVLQTKSERLVKKFVVD